MTKVYMLFSVDANYDQPDRAFICWWSKKPSIEMLAKILNVDFMDANDDMKASIVSIWCGKCERLMFDTTYWIEEVEEGKLLGERGS